MLYRLSGPLVETFSKQDKAKVDKTVESICPKKKKLNKFWEFTVYLKSYDTRSLNLPSTVLLSPHSIDQLQESPHKSVYHIIGFQWTMAHLAKVAECVTKIHKIQMMNLLIVSASAQNNLKAGDLLHVIFPIPCHLLNFLFRHSLISKIKSLREEKEQLAHDHRQRQWSNTNFLQTFVKISFCRLCDICNTSKSTSM